MAIVQLVRVALRVCHLEQSLRFYRDVLGCREVARSSFPAGASAALGREAGPFASAVLECGGVCLELVAAGEATESRARAGGDRGEAPLEGSGLSHLIVAVDDLRSTLHSLRDRGVRVVEEGVREHARGVATAVVADPDGFRILLYERPVGVAGDEAPIDPAATGGAPPRGSPLSRAGRAVRR